MRQTCTCENCGNEADMVVTCTWVEVEEAGEVKKKKQETRKCTVCGNEADMIVEDE